MYNPYYMPASLHPKRSNTKLVIIVIVVMAAMAVAVMVLGRGGSLFTENVTTNNTTNSDSHKKCIGSETHLVSESGVMKLKDLKVGDKVLTYDRKNNKTNMSTIHWIRVHDNTQHYRIKTNNSVFNLSPMHLAMLESNEYKQARFLSVGDKLLTSEGAPSEIIDITLTEDVAMSPIVVDGTIVMTDYTVVSCWSGDKENADKMDMLADIVRRIVDMYTISELEDIIENFYMSFLESGKDVNKVSNILQELNIPITCK
jgi:hypothetical protein